MKKTLVWVATVAVAALVVPVAHAGPPYHTTTAMTARIASASSSAGDTATGGCFFVTDKTFGPLGSQDTGVIGDLSLTRDAAGRPTAATVTCKIEINGVDAYGTTQQYSGPVPATAARSTVETSTGVEFGVTQIAIDAFEGDSVVLCESVTFADDHSSTGWVCQSATEITVPSQGILDLLSSVFAIADPIVCPILAAHAGSYGVDVFGDGFVEGITIKRDGDVYIRILDDNLVYDCPPY